MHIQARAGFSPFLVHALHGAHQLLMDQDNWAYRAVARDRQGRIVKPVAEEATCWSAEGAVARYSPGGVLTREAIQLLDSIAQVKLGDECAFEASDRGPEVAQALLRWALETVRGDGHI